MYEEDFEESSKNRKEIVIRTRKNYKRRGKEDATSSFNPPRDIVVCR